MPVALPRFSAVRIAIASRCRPCQCPASPIRAVPGRCYAAALPCIGLRRRRTAPSTELCCARAEHRFAVVMPSFALAAQTTLLHRNALPVLRPATVSLCCAQLCLALAPPRFAQPVLCEALPLRRNPTPLHR